MNTSISDDLYMTFLYLLIIVLVIVLFTVPKKWMKHNFDKLRKQTQQKEEEKERNRKSKELFKKVNSKHYDLKKDEILDVLAGTFNIDRNSVIEYYERGKSIVEEEHAAENERRLKEQLEKNQQILEENEKMIDEEMNKTLVVGKDKYIKYLEEKKKTVKAVSNLYNIMGDAYISGASQASRPQETDPYIWAGMANGIAGPAAAIMTANDIERENAKKRAQAKQIAENSMSEAVRYKKMASDEEKRTSGIVGQIEYNINYIKEALVNNNTEKNKELINVEYIDIEKKEYNLIDIKIKTKLNDIKILDKEGILDGSFSIKLLDSDNRLIAEGYYNGRNYYVDPKGYYMSSDIGFNNGERTIRLLATDLYNYNDKDKYHCEIEPIHLWIIEKK